MTMQSDPLSDLLKVRLLVGYLGEIDQFGWWKTSFYQSASQAFLAPIFPRTGHVAKYHGVAEAARLVHDESLSAGSYHLFRLPEELEHDLHTALAEAADQAIREVSLHGKDAAVEELRAMSEESISPLDGPISLGQISALRASHSIAQVAGIYADAFQRGNKAFPYFSRA
ncbi:BrxE family protein [Rhizobium leguminosarum]|uniref:BrxE family protein n=1 Tax=Rhizobium leguminosarum TaxID=384 RepID=UPI0018D55BD4|nr:BrxE family protein [Rhizobium leguminosarum]